VRVKEREMSSSSRNAELQAQYDLKKENLQTVCQCINATIKCTMLMRVIQLVEKLTDLESQNDEHTVVLQRSVTSIDRSSDIDSLQPMPRDRKCFRMIGGTLVERTVGEVIPALEETQTGVNYLFSCID